MATDRSTASKLTNILSEVPFDKIWVPLNRGDDNTWGALLNENWETIVRTFVNLDERIVSNVEELANVSLQASEAVAIGQQNANSIGLINQSLLIISSGITAVTDEVVLSRGNLSSLDERLDVSFDDDGIRKPDVIMSGIYTANYVVKDVSYSNTTNIYDISSYMTSEPFGNGQGYGIVPDRSYGDPSKVDNICHILDSSGMIIRIHNGRTVYGRIVNNLGSAMLSTFELDDSNTEQSVTIPSGTSLRIFIPKIFDYYTSPKMDSIHETPIRLPKASATEYGIIKMGHTNGTDADSVDGIHASVSPEAGKLYPLDEEGNIAASVVKIYTSGIGSYLETEAPLYLKSRTGDTLKDIDYYLSAYGIYASGYIFAKVKDGDYNAQFTKTLSEIETTLDNNSSDITQLQIDVDINASGLATLEGIIASGVLDAESYASGILVNHEGNIDAHHRADSYGINIQPLSIISGSGTFDDLTTGKLTVDELIVNIETTLRQQQTYIVDRFMELGKIDTTVYDSGVVVTEITTSGMGLEGALVDQYACGIAFHNPDIVSDVSGVIISVEDKVTMLRYNKTTGRFEYAVDWIPPSGTVDINAFMGMSASRDPQSLLVWQDGSTGETCDYNEILPAISGLLGNGGKITIREGNYSTENIAVSSGILIEGCGSKTILGNITISGNNNMITKLSANAVVLVSGVHRNSINFNWITSDITDNSNQLDNVIFGNIPLS